MQTNKKSNDEKNIIALAINTYLPYWPLFLILIVFCLAGAWAYMRFIAVPVYETNATFVVKDEKKGVDESGALEALQIYPTKNIAENEMEVIRSTSLMETVVKELQLYAPVYEDYDLKDGKFNVTSAYLTSPVSIIAGNPDELKETGDTDVYFSVNYFNANGTAHSDNGDKAKLKEVVFNNKAYPVNEWCSTPYGQLKFEPNSKRTDTVVGPLFFQLYKPKNITQSILLNLVVNTPNKLSSTIDLTLRDAVPKRAQEILNKLLLTYYNESIEEKKAIAVNTLKFIDARLAGVEREIDSIENKIKTFRTDKSVVDLTEQGKMYLGNVGDNDKKIADLSMQLAAVDEMENYVSSKDNKDGLLPSTLGVADPVLSDLMTKLYNARVEYESLLKTTAENNPYVTTKAKEIEELRPLILEKLKNYRRSMDAGKKNLVAISSNYNSMLNTIPQKEKELMAISRDELSKKTIYSLLLQKREQTALTISSADSDSKIVDMAYTTLLPVSPRKLLFYAGAFVAAIGLGIGKVSLKEMFNRKIMFRSEIEELTNVPVIAELSANKEKESLLESGSRSSLVAEQFRHLRAAIGLCGRKKERSIKRILVTSCIPREGKTYISTNLAASLAMAGNKVVLVDLDIRKPRTSAIMGIDRKAGVAEFLAGSKTPLEIIMTTANENLFVVGAGRSEEDSRELILSGKLDALFAHLSSQFDYVILDAAPIDPVSDSYTFFDCSDITLFVIRHSRTPKDLVQRLDNNDKFKALKNPRIVFNGIRSRGILKRMYGYNYGYGYENVYRERNGKKSKLLKAFSFSKDKKVRV